MGKRMQWGWLAVIVTLAPAAGCLQFHPRESGDPVGKLDGSARNGPLLGLLSSPKNQEEQARLFLETARQLEAAEPEQAIAFYEKAREHDPRCAPAVTKRLAVLYDMVDKFDRALVEYQLAIQQNPRDADVWNDLGYGYYNRGNWKQAEDALRKAVAINPKHPKAWTNLGMATAQQGRFDESLAHFQKVVGKPQAYCNLGFLLAAQGRKHEARTAYLEALNLEPGLQIARIALAKIDDIDVNRPLRTKGKETTAKSTPRPEAMRNATQGSEEESNAQAFESVSLNQAAPSLAPTARPRSGFEQAIPLPLPKTNLVEEDETAEPELLDPALPHASHRFARLTNSPK